MPKLDPRQFEVVHAGTRIAGEAIGAGPDVVLAHGLTATRRYVVMGSRVLPRAGFRLTTYDARGHGESSAAHDAAAYGYEHLAGDLEAVVEHLGADTAVVGGASMGAATAAAFALRRPRRVGALVLITPAFDGRPTDAQSVREWDALAEGLERDGVDGFLAAYHPAVNRRWRDTVLKVARQRLERHRDLRAVAAAVRAVPRSVPFDGLEELERLDVPALIVGSRDEPDPGHPLRISEAYAARLPHARLVVEDPGRSPLAWQGAQLSREIKAFLAQLES